MEKSLKGKTREYRRACKAAGFKPAEEGKPLEDGQFPLRGAFVVMRNGKVVPPAEVRLEDTIHEHPSDATS